MAFALFYDDTDLRRIATQLTRPDLPTAVKANAVLAWDNGFKRWQVAEGATYDRLQGDPFTRVTVISASNMHLSQFVSLLRSIASAFPADSAAEYMDAIANDLESGTFGNNDSAIEPWTGN